MLKEELQQVKTAQLAPSEEAQEAIREGAESEHRHKPVKFVTLHRVVCSDRLGDDHDKMTYLDPPRLFKGDMENDHFRGTIEVGHLGRYLEDHPEVAFAVVKDYTCTRYAIRLIMSKEGQLGPRGRVLVQDHHPEEGGETEIMIGPATQAGIEAILEAFPNRFPGFQDVPTFLDGHYDSKDSRFSRLSKPYFLFTFESLDIVDMDDSKRESLRLLCRWIEDNYRKEWDEADALFAQGKVNDKHFDTLFRPGELLVRDTADEDRLLSGAIVPLFPTNVDPSDEVNFFHWKFNGSLLRASIPPRMPGDSPQILWGSAKPPRLHNKLMDITSLEWYPLRFASENIKAKLVARGQRFWTCRRQKLVCYKDPGADSVFKAERRFMIDYAMYKRLHPTSSTLSSQVHNFALHVTYETHEPFGEAEEPPDEFLYCLPPTIHGFDFTTKTWETLKVDRITDVTWNKEAFSQLVAPPETKELIQAVVSAHGERKNMGLDIIEGKGQGLLVLLHGGPGTGKTLTAESIAEEQERPLYRVTCGDVGTEPKEVEKYLGDVLEIGRAWGCVVLLDEADVFLEERSFSDQKRNAIISIFLRILEYYDGILILTTNRIGSFDEAFKSRIQLALGYPPLNEEDRFKIWSNFVQMLPRTKDRIDMEDLQMNLCKLAQFDINGREIRNIITMARHLAKFRGQMLRYKHMQDALESAQKFSKYLNNVKGVSDDDWARADKLR
ncbi:hypothetical protein NW754_005281 [Fusarium falciforme]|nr:hypothetical protein NW754_005281 [Fusarium falciforme]